MKLFSKCEADRCKGFKLIVTRPTIKVPVGGPGKIKKHLCLQHGRILKQAFPQ